MTTYAQGRDELVAALVADGVRCSVEYGGIEPPCAVVFSEGAELASIGRGQVPWTYRVTLLAGGMDASGVAAELDTLRGTALGTVQALAGWRVDRLGRDAIRQVAGASILAADLFLTRMIDI